MARSREALLAEYRRLCVGDVPLAPGRTYLSTAITSENIKASEAHGGSAREVREKLAWLPDQPKIVPGFFDNPPSGAITAEKVREFVRNNECGCEPLGHDCGCRERYLKFVLEGLAKHPGVSSTARAVIEEALR